MYMEKTFNYNFIPSKAEEEELKANNAQHKVTRTLVEINSFYSRPVNECDNGVMIKKRITLMEAVTEKIQVSYLDTFRHFLPYWSMHMANHVVIGNRARVTVYDVTDSNNRKRYSGDLVYFKMLPDDNYYLNCKPLFSDRRLLFNDEIGLSWDTRTSTFRFKLLRRAI